MERKEQIKGYREIELKKWEVKSAVQSYLDSVAGDDRDSQGYDASELIGEGFSGLVTKDAYVDLPQPLIKCLTEMCWRIYLTGRRDGEVLGKCEQRARVAGLLRILLDESGLKIGLKSEDGN